jgi:hypothetical protein
MFFENSQPSEGLNSRQRIVVILMNLFLLAELTFSIFLGNQDKENMTAVFITAFLPMVLVTLVLARLLIRRMGSIKVEGGRGK